MTTTPEPDRAAGVLLGLAAGDRNGGPVQMALRLAESLGGCGGFDPRDVGRRYLDWWVKEGFDTGAVAARVFERVHGGASFEEASRAVDRALDGLTAGCNAAHRTPPLAMCRAIADGDLASAANADARLTHAHPLAGDAAAAVVVLCRGLIRGMSWDAAVAQAALGRLDPTRRAVVETPEDLVRGGFSPETLAAALHFLHRGRDFGQTLQDAVDFAGPANYCPVLVGAIAGARWGARGIPDEALQHCPSLLPRLRAAAEALATPWVS